MKRKEGVLVCLPNQCKSSQRDGFMEGLATDMHAAMSTILSCLPAPLGFCKTAVAIRLCTLLHRITWNSHCDKKKFRITPHTDKPPGTSSVDEVWIRQRFKCKDGNAGYMLPLKGVMGFVTYLLVPWRQSEQKKCIVVPFFFFSFFLFSLCRMTKN